MTKSAENTKQGPPGPPERIGTKSVLISLRSEAELGDGIRLRDIDDEQPLPELWMGAEKFLILSELGEGGMGKVYLASTWLTTRT